MCHMLSQVEEEHSAILGRLEARLGDGDQVTADSRVAIGKLTLQS